MPKLDGIFNKTFTFAAQEARQFYFQVWQKSQQPCPTFANETIAITRIGWNHLLTAEHRTKLDLLGRFFVLERAKCLLETTTQYQEYEQRQEEEFWALIGIVEEVKIKVILRSIKGSQKHLYSVLRLGTVKQG